MQATSLLGVLVLAGLMGMAGQGARTIVGLKKLHDTNSTLPPNQQDPLLASRLVVSLMIGFIAGVLAALAMSLEKLAGSGDIGPQALFGLAAAGYAGTDFIEGFMAKTPLPGTATQPDTPGSAPPDVTGKGKPADVAAEMEASLTSQLNQQTSELQAEIASLKTLMSSGMTEASWSSLPVATQLTPELVARLFVPATPLGNIKKHLPHIVAGLRSYGIADRDMLLMALATIRAETEGFAPIDEMKSKYNTEKEPFDLYGPGTPIGKRLGNSEPGDGARFKGRGFIQLTGRDNYTRIGAQISTDLPAEPALANEPRLAGLILACFLSNKEDAIRSALANGDLKTARKLVNGGSHGFDRFKDAYDKGIRLIPVGIDI